MSSTPIPSSDKVLLCELVVGAQKTFGNAEALFREASLLTKARCFSRALFLHQISLEECAKIEILGAYATGLLMGHHVDFAKVRNALISHARKNRTNAYFLAGLREEEAARQSGDVQKAIKSFSEMQERFHLKSNTAKNASLYVDFKDQKFVAPNECITFDMVAEIAALNKEFLGLSFQKLEMLLRWQLNPEGISKQLSHFEKRLYDLVSEGPDNPLEAMELLLREMLEEERGLSE